MKIQLPLSRHLFFWLLLTAHSVVQAQVYELAALGVGLGLSALKGKPQDPKQYVATLPYKGQKIKQKRTPIEKLKGKSAVEIAQVESVLAASSAKLLANDVDAICGETQYDRINQLLTQINNNQHNWSIAAYEEENNFYRLENDQRTRLRQVAEQQRQRDAHLALQRRKQRTQDSLAQTQRRLLVVADSLHRIQTQHNADSLAQLAKATGVRYLATANARLRTIPEGRVIGEVEGGSYIKLIKRLGAWSYIDVNGVPGYLPSHAMVLTLDSVSLAGVHRIDSKDFPLNAVLITDGEGDPIRAVTPSALLKAGRAPIARPSTSRPSHRQATGPRVYVCGGGSSYAYHSSDSCSGLNRCSSGLSAVSLAVAQNMGRTPCKKCH